MSAATSATPTDSPISGPGDTRLMIETPEGAALPFPVAGAGERLLAYVVDFMFIMLTVAVVVVPFAILLETGSGWAIAIMSIAVFLVTNFYFTWHEIRHSGSTPGKRRVGLQVINRNGGALTVQAVLVRNLTRNIEVTLPMQIVMAPKALFESNEAAGLTLAVGWIFLVSALPLFNRYRLRPGDLLAGTIVVDVKQTELEGDIAADALQLEATFGFTAQQLAKYGIYELQVLEEYLRTPSHTRPLSELVLAQKIMTKIGWDGEKVSRRQAETFLRDFYAAQRRRLEQDMLLGKRKETKNH